MFKILKYITLVVFSFITVLLVLNSYERYLDKQISSLSINQDIRVGYGLDVKDKGLTILQKSIDNNDLIILGSSELGVDVPQNPKVFFPNDDFKWNSNIVGKAYAQSLVNAIRVGALGNALNGKKVVLVVSLQWFEGKDISSSGTQANLSELQFYKFMNQPDINYNDKLYVSNRLGNLLKYSTVNNRVYLYSKIFQQNNAITDLFMWVLKPYYWMREKFLSLKDKHDAYKKLRESDKIYKKELLDIDWEEEYIKAENCGRASCTNNIFFVDDIYYNRYLKNNILDLTNSKKNVVLNESQEFKDFELLLKTFKTYNIKPYIILMSTNGWYYDYIGIDREKRHLFYDKIEDNIRNYGFDFLDLRDKEYEPYFYKDVMHLGWKGWLYVCQKISEHYK